MGGGAVDWLDHGWVFLFRIQVRGRSDVNRSHYRRPQVGQNIAEEIGADNNVKPVRVSHKVSRQDIDVILIGSDIRLFSGHRLKAFIPERYGIDDSVWFCR